MSSSDMLVSASLPSPLSKQKEIFKKRTTKGRNVGNILPAKYTI
jgi:hypothetical protein